MRQLLLVLTVTLICAQARVCAQEHSLVREGKIPSIKMVAAEPVPNTPEWQLTLDVIKSKAGVLMDKNTQLTLQHDSLLAELRKAQEENRDIQLKNEELRQILKQRRGRSEQQTQIDALVIQIKAKEIELNGFQKDLSFIQKESADLDRKLHLKKLKVADLEARQKTNSFHSSVKNVLAKKSVTENDEELNQVKEKLQFERDQEELLVTQIQEYKEGAQMTDVSPSADEGETKALQTKVDFLGKQKEDLQKRLSVDNGQVTAEKYLALMAKKKDLESKIKESEDQLEEFKDPQVLGFWDPKQKKKIVHQLIQVDGHNAQIRQKISGLHENTKLLREQVSRLERKVDRLQGSAENNKEEK